MTRTGNTAHGGHLWPLVRAQRGALGDLLRSLEDTQWDAPSLCRGWRVRDVAAHCVQSHVATPWRLVREMVGAGFRLDVRNQRWVERHRQATIPDLLDEYQATADQNRVPSSEARYALVEAVVHAYDIARPLGLPIAVPSTSLITVAETCRTTNVFLHGKRRAAGLTLRADDLEWTAGDGPEVIGPIASIILAVTGRSTALTDLSGAGLSTLRARLT
ncbi:maleylpyruvate isomerase family mycothiol-dependent enzyme [Actinocrispum wychmicini]|uniref:Uncharacterized protein (TIGR03083 family) n=1 Tax=Actinocrispum wychmicini TaxID=1213861 RepID=A0A4R2JVW5_9PSEU|nr:maleylpyruvate isomerase family mycothiol-dependent enzyme [Actinocrispum wychmicini]TCO58315.1 uncharacterized protein (TIGR03083 family) [Actinocrispum wychmicini]